MTTTQKPIRLFVGLGNPGPQYSDTRHNAGAWYIHTLANNLRCTLNPEARFFGEVGKTRLNGHDVWLLIPTTYMNRSGQAVLALANFFKILPDEILVAHDELDLLPGQLKIKQGGGNAGHNGLKDIQNRLGSPDFWRARIGIGHPRTLGLNQGVADFVLHRPSSEHQLLIDRSIHILQTHSNQLIEGQLNQAITRIHSENATM